MKRDHITRRNALKGIAGFGGIAVLGGMAINGGAASNLTISAGDVNVANDTGDLNIAYVAPDFEVEWSNFDEPVGKVRVLVEAARAGQTYDGDLPGGPYDYVPVFRATPWINGDPQEGGNGPITTGYYDNPTPWPIALFKEGYTRPEYDVTEDTSVLTHWDGTSVGDNAGAYLNGMYGAVGPTTPFEESVDGAVNETDINLRFTVSLHALEPTSPLVMYDEYGAPFQYPEFYDASGDVPANAIPYPVLRENDQHPAINVTEITYTQSVENEPAQQGFGGDANSGGDGDDVSTPTPTGTPTGTPE